MKTITTPGRRGEDLKSGTKQGLSTSYSEYRRYEQRGNVGEHKFERIDSSSNNAKYQTIDDGEFIVINCPVHGRQTIRRNNYKKLNK